MTDKIILSSDEKVTCPACQRQFEIGLGITRQTIERYEQDFESALKERSAALRQELEAEAERRLARIYTAQLNDLKEQLLDKQHALTEAKGRLEAVHREAQAKVREEFHLEKAMLEKELSDKDGQLRQMREQELALRQEKKKLEADRQQMDLELQRKLDEERKRLEEHIRQGEADRFRLKEAEYQKRIEDAQKANEDLRRKLEQGSQQLQGEVLELELEGLLNSSFPLDKIEPVRKGARGADVLHTVVTRTGQVCGKIIWEAKRAEHWSNAWIPKLKDDQRDANAEIAVLVTTTMPKQVTDPFCIVEDIWVVDTLVIRPLAETLRLMLIETHKHKVTGLNKNEKMEALYQYLCSPQFAQKIRAVVDTFASMKRDLDSERVAMARIWKKREQQLGRATINMVGMCGELQAIAQDSLPQLNNVATLSLPEDDLGDENTAYL